MVALSRKLAQEAGVGDKAQFVEADMYEYDISKATVMALFLLPVNMNRLAPKFFNLAPGSRIVANTFGIDGWEPDERVTLPPASRVRELVRGAVVDRAREGRRHVGDAERLDDADAGVPGGAGHDHDRRAGADGRDGPAEGRRDHVHRRRHDLQGHRQGQHDHGIDDDAERRSPVDRETLSGTRC